VAPGKERRVSFEAELRLVVRQAVRDAVREEMRELVQEVAGREPAAFLRVGEAAEVAAVHPQTVRRWIARRRLPVHGEGRMVRIKRQDLERLMKGGPDEGPIDFVARANALRAKRAA
jgi:excisionase family DNA binding protein